MQIAPKLIAWLCLAACWALLTVAEPASAHKLGHAHEIAPAQSAAEAERYLTEYRHSGDDAWLHAAEPLLWFTASPEQAELKLLRVWHAQAQHKFGRALAELQPLLATGARRPGLWLLRANLLRVQGRYAEAKQSCREVISTKILAGQLCMVQVDLAAGESVAEQRAELLTRFADNNHQATAEAGWAYDVLAQFYASIGRTDAALGWARRAFAIENSVQRRAALAQLLLKTNQAEAVLTLVEDRPKAPALVVLRLTALKDLGQLTQHYDEVAEVDRVFRNQLADEDFLHAREMARFYLEILPRPALARQLALTNWQYQREAEDRELLALTRPVHSHHSRPGWVPTQVDG